jgi:hypothetical protein
MREEVRHGCHAVEDSRKRYGAERAALLNLVAGVEPSLSFKQINFPLKRM